MTSFFPVCLPGICYTASGGDAVMRKPDLRSVLVSAGESQIPWELALPAIILYGPCVSRGQFSGLQSLPMSRVPWEGHAMSRGSFRLP